MSSPSTRNGFILHYDRKKQQLKLSATGALTVVLLIIALMTVAIVFLVRH